MSIEDNVGAYAKAKEMLIAGESFPKIMDETNLRLKDLKRIQREEINNHF